MITATKTNSLGQQPKNYTEVKQEGRSLDPHRSLYRMGRTPFYIARATVAP